MSPRRKPHLLRVAALQPELSFDRPDESLAAIRDQLHALHTEGRADLLVLPELFDGRPESANEGRATEFLRSLARESGANVIGGSCLITEGGGRRVNRCFVFGADGRPLGHYDKRVLFAGESKVREAGDRPAVFDLDGVRVGVLVCADLWHPELARELVGRVDVLAVPVKSSVPARRQVEYARSLWHAMALTRAIENGFVVVVSDWPAGREPHGKSSRHPHYTAGAACIVDPSHRPDLSRIQHTAPNGKPTVLRADIDLDAMAAFRAYRRSVGLLPGQDAGGGPHT